MPSSRAVSFGPWLSPAVRKRNSDISVPSNRSAHHFYRRLLPGPQLESSRSLVHQHAQTVDGLGAGLAGQQQKWCRQARLAARPRGIDQIVDDLAQQDRDGEVPGQGIAVDMQAEACSIDNQVGAL